MWTNNSVIPGARRRVTLLAVTLVLVALIVGGTALALSYRSAFEEEEEFLEYISEGQARLFAVMLRHEYHEMGEGIPDLQTVIQSVVEQWRLAHYPKERLNDRVEIAVGRLDGERVIYLLRQHPSSSALPMELSLSDAVGLHMRLALRGESGVMVGPDYRGVEVLGAFEPVEGYPLAVVAKVDMDRLRQPFQHLARVMVMVALGVSLTGLLLVQRQGGSILFQLQEVERTRRFLYDNMLNGVAHCRVISVDGRPRDFIYLNVNQAFERLTGLKAVVGRRVTEVIPGLLEEVPELLEIYGRVASTGQPEQKEIHIPALDMWFAISVYSPELQEFVAVFDVITQRKRAEQALQRINRHLRTLSKCNSVLVRATSESHLLTEICRELVETGGYPFAWVGFREEDERCTVTPRAWFGPHQAYLNQVTVTWDDAPTGRGPTGRAIRTGQVQVVRDLATDSACAPWRDLARDHDLASCVALPLISSGIVLGTLNVYSSSVDAFDENELALLQELAMDVAYGIAALRRKELVDGAIRELRVSEERLRSVLGNMPVLLDAFDQEGNIIFWSHECERVTGFSAAEMVNNPGAMGMLYPDPAYLAAMREEWQRRGNRYRDWEWELTCKNGTVRRIAWSNNSDQFPVPGWHQWGIGVDVTQRSQAEAQLAASVEEKTLLLKEIHHRVKNNLQIISGLLQLQAGALRRQGVENTLLEEAFRESQQRIRAMALVHERLYRSRDLRRVNFQSYLHLLLEELTTLYAVNRSKVRLLVRMGAMDLPIDQAIPCGLIVNELVSNALKHAFRKGDAGVVEVGLTPRDQEVWLLEVRDNGAGLPLGFSPTGSDTLGLRLVTTLVHQLDGEITFTSDGGTKVSIEFRRGSA